MTVYLDCNATTPLEPRVQSVIQRYMEEEYGNAASPVHQYGEGARMAVETGRTQVARVVGARRDEVIFTSGATEANNLAVLGLADYGLATGRRHLVTTALEHKSVLEPMEYLASRGFSLTILPADSSGRVSAQNAAAALRPDTLLVSVMQVNNETGIRQPVEEIATVLEGHDAFFHVDAAQGFGKELVSLQHPRIDMISASAHKIFGPKGVGALIARRRGGSFPPLQPLQFGGGQEQGLRPGTLAVPLIAGFGTAASMAVRHEQQRHSACEAFRRQVFAGLQGLTYHINGDPQYCLPHTLNISLPGVPTMEAVRVVKEHIAISSGSACTAHTAEPSHVLHAMGLSEKRVATAVRLAWCHLTPPVDWPSVVQQWKQVMNKGE